MGPLGKVRSLQTGELFRQKLYLQALSFPPLLLYASIGNKLKASLLMLFFKESGGKEALLAGNRESGGNCFIGWSLQIGELYRKVLD